MSVPPFHTDVKARPRPTGWPEIRRDQVILTLNSFFDAGLRFLVVEGADGIGKTTVLGQFADTYPQRTIAVFLSAASRWAYDPEMVAADLHARISEILGTAVAPNKTIGKRELGRAYNKLHARATRNRTPYFFVLDGVEDIPEHHAAAAGHLLDLLPFGRTWFRFVISARCFGDLPLTPDARRISKTYTMSVLGRGEVSDFLASYDLSEDQLGKVYGSTQGMPASVASVWKLLQSGKDVSDVVEGSDLLELEWRDIDPEDSSTLDILALMSTEERPFPAKEIAALLELTPDDVKTRLARLTFIDIDDSDLCTFSHPSAARFVSRRLANRKDHIRDLLICSYQDSPDSPAALNCLPIHYVQSGRPGELIDFLTPVRFADMYKGSSSLETVKNHVDRGLAAAEALARNGERIRFALQRSAIEEISHSRAKVAEASAHAAVGDYDTAMAIAEATNRTEEKLRLLTAVATIMHRHGFPEERQVIDRIRDLYNEFDHNDNPRLVPDLATNLFLIAPDLAVDLVGKLSANEKGSNSAEFAMTSVLIQAQLGNGDPNAKGSSDIFEKPISSPNLRRLMMRAVGILGNLSASEVLAHAKKISSVEDRLYLYRQWMRGNRTRGDAIEVFFEGVRLAIKSTEYSATAFAFSDLALCIPSVGDKDHLARALSLLDGQLPVVEHIGPTQAYVSLALLMARGAHDLSEESALKRLESVYSYLDAESDKTVCAGGLARLRGVLLVLGHSETDLYKVVDLELGSTVDHLLDGCAEHYEATEEVIRGLAAVDPEYCLTLIQRINTGWRRSEALGGFVEACLFVPAKDLRIAEIKKALSSIESYEVFDDAVGALVSKLSATGDSSVFDDSTVEFLVSALRRVTNVSLRVSSLADFYSQLLRASEIDASSRQKVAVELYRSWDRMDAGWQKLEIGFDIVTKVADVDLDLARRLGERIGELRGQRFLRDEQSTAAAGWAILLANRAVAGMLEGTLATENDLDRLVRLIDRCGGAEERIEHFTDLAVRAYFAERPDVSKSLVENSILPLLDSLDEDQANYEYRLTVVAAPALHLGLRAAAKAILLRLPKLWQEDARHRIAWTLLTRVPIGDAYEFSRPGLMPSYDTICQVIDVVHSMTVDWHIYSIIVEIVDSALSAERHGTIKRAQKADIARQLSELVSTKFPSPSGVSHEGYIIVAESHINRLRPKEDKVSTEGLAKRARAVPNTADRAFVLAVIGVFASKAKDRAPLLNEARSVIQEIPSLLDRVGRLEQIAVMANSKDGAFCRSLLHEAANLLLRGEAKSIQLRRRSLINAAYRIDPEFAETLAQAVDDDPAKNMVNRQLEIFRLRDTLMESRRPAQSAIEKEEPRFRDIVDAAWLRLGSLQAGRVKSVPDSHYLTALKNAPEFSMSESYPLYALFVENCVRNELKRSRPSEKIRPLFEACVMAAELAALTSEAYDPKTDGELAFDHSDSDLYRSGERKRALERIRLWVQSLAPNETITIVDPYFRPVDVDLLVLICENSTDTRVEVLTGMDSLKEIDGDARAAFLKEWAERRSERPPETRIVVVGTRDSHRCPFHDRLYLTEEKGLSVGSSYGGLGKRDSIISEFPNIKAQQRLSEFRPYLRQERREVDGDRLTYQSFEL